MIIKKKYCPELNNLIERLNLEKKLNEKKFIKRKENKNIIIRIFYENKELENVNFNINEDINIDVSLILFDYAEKEINELLTQYVKTPVIFQNKLKLHH